MPREGLEGSLMRVLIGNTAERVLESLPCDVLVVKPEGFEKPRISTTRTAMPVCGGQKVLHSQSQHLGEIAHRRLTDVALPVSESR